MTLVEIIVAIFVYAILLTVLVRLFSASVRIGSEELSRSSTETSLMMALRTLEGDLQNTTPSGVALQATGDGLVVHPMKDVSSDGQVTYVNEVVYWRLLAPEETLVRTVFQDYFGASFDLRPHRLDGPAILDLNTNPNGDVSRTVNLVEAFGVENPAGVMAPSVGSPLLVSMTARVDRAETRRQVTLEKFIHVRTGAN